MLLLDEKTIFVHCSIGFSSVCIMMLVYCLFVERSLV